MKKNIAEFIGTFWLVLGGCGSAVLAAGFPDVGIGLVGCFPGVWAYSCNNSVFSWRYIRSSLKPCCNFGLWAGGRVNSSDIAPYVISQILGAIAAAGVLYIIATGNGSAIGDFAANGYGEHSPGKYNLTAALVTEFVMTFIF
jgi:aquaporin Z